jgi:hypothetical protein
MIEDFFHLPPQWFTLNWEYFREFSKKFKTAVMVYSGGWGKLIHGKKSEVENLVTLTVPLSCVPLCAISFNF